MTKTIVEVAGNKVEIDLREANKIETFKVGDTIKLLKKDYSTYKVYPAIVAGFDQFELLPTIIVAYLETSYSGADVNFCYINAESKECEICAIDSLDIPFEKQHALDLFNTEIMKRENEILDIKRKKSYFEKYFQKYFGDISKDQ